MDKTASIKRLESDTPPRRWTSYLETESGNTRQSSGPRRPPHSTTDLKYGSLEPPELAQGLSHPSLTWRAMAEAKKLLNHLELAIESAGNTGPCLDSTHRDLERVLETLRTPISTQAKGVEQLRREQAALLTRAVLARDHLRRASNVGSQSENTSKDQPNDHPPPPEGPPRVTIIVSMRTKRTTSQKQAGAIACRVNHSAN